MNTQTKLAILSIAIMIPLVSFVVYGTDSNLKSTQTQNNSLSVISSFAPLHDFSQNVGKEKINSTLLVPVGVEPHDWEPTIKDVQRMEASDLIVINGIGFENWVDSLKENSFQGIIVDTSNGIPINTNNDHSEGDPHIWLNPVYAKIQVQNIANAFSNADPTNRDYYQINAAEYIEQLDSLDSKIRDDLSSCDTDFIAFHDAFSYFAKEYDLTQHTIISSNNSHGEATAKTLENVISLARELNIKVIFSEESVNNKTSEIIATEIDGVVLILSPLEVISEGNYISKMTQNLENLKEALC